MILLTLSFISFTCISDFLYWYQNNQNFSIMYMFEFYRLSNFQDIKNKSTNAGGWRNKSTNAGGGGTSQPVQGLGEQVNQCRGGGTSQPIQE